MRFKFEAMCREAQLKITKAIEDVDGEAVFKEDAWTRDNGGGGMSRVMSGGKVFEKAGVNLSVVYGSMPAEALIAATERGVDRAKGMKPGERVPFFACGLSSVMHPRNPFCPTMHFNYRYFETDGGLWWFGGGTDITPAYVNEEVSTLASHCCTREPLLYPRGTVVPASHCCTREPLLHTLTQHTLTLCMLTLCTLTLCTLTLCTLTLCTLTLCTLTLHYVPCITRYTLTLPSFVGHGALPR